MVTCRFLVLLLASWVTIAFMSGCATVTGGTKQEVTIESEPSGAAVRINGIERGMTPLTVDLPRKESHLVEIQKEGFAYYDVVVEPKMNNAVYGNVVAGGAVGMLVDGSNGAGNSLHPTEIHAILEER